MKLIYISNTRMPHNRAHSIQVAKMAEAFNKTLPTTLIVPLKLNSSREKTYLRYNISSRFNITYIPSIDFIFMNLGIFFFYLQSFTYSFLAVLYSLFLQKEYYYTRDIFSSFFLCISRFVHRKKVFYEIHGEPTRFEKLFVKWTLHRLDGIIFLNNYIAEYYSDMNKNVMIAQDGVDLSLFAKKEERKLLRQKLNLAKDKKIVMYSGHLYKWKGIFTLLDSTAYLPESYAIYILGGTQDDIARVKHYISANGIKNVTLLGYVDYGNVAQYLLAADILVLPNSSKSKFSNIYTSPLKLFEYMASGNIIVATDVPSSREILNKKNSILVQPDNPEDLAAGIKRAANTKASRLAEKCLEDVTSYSWDERAKNILEFIH